MGKKIQAKKHRCKDCGMLLVLADFENDPDICWRCWKEYKQCKKCGEYYKKPDIIYVGKGDYMCVECADVCGVEKEDEND